ncbi:MAG: type II toxin-antitoxin system VapC family toxin [Candidatus Acidiferrales bacterium]
MSDFVLDASVALQWFLKDEVDRAYSLRVLDSLREKHALVPVRWLYEVGNALVTACRRKRISIEQVEGFRKEVWELPIDVAQQSSAEILSLPRLALLHGLTNYDATYLALAQSSKLPIATADSDLRKAALATRVGLYAFE